MRAGNKPCELLYDTLLLSVVHPHVHHVDSHEADIEVDSPTLVEGLRQLRPKPVDRVVGPDHNQFVTVGESLLEADVRARTGSTIVAVERDGDVLTEFDPSFVLADGDDVIVVGSDDAVDRFRAELA